jgi:hypothetical protein
VFGKCLLSHARKAVSGATINHRKSDLRNDDAQKSKFRENPSLHGCRSRRINGCG